MSDDARTLGSILAEVIDRRRAGERPTPGEYVKRFPWLRREIEGHFRTLEILEPDDAATGTIAEAGKPSGAWLGERIARLPPLIQRLIYLRNFEKRKWEDIARELGRPEMDLRRDYARAIGGLIDPR